MRSLLILVTFSLAAAPARHTLRATQETVVVGHYDAATTPVLRIASGDIVTIETLGVSSPEQWVKAGLAPEKLEPARIAVAKANPAARGHYLTGPIFVEGAEPGDTLRVEIRGIKMTYPWAYNGMGRNGVLAAAYPEGGSRVIPLDLKNKAARFAPGVTIPLRPFFGSMGVAPPLASGRLSSSPPGRHAGNLDNKELVAGTTLFIPIHTAGALFQAGDGHAAMGDGEADQTALETSLTGEFRFTVEKGRKLEWPRGETPTHYIAMGLDPDINTAIRIAAQEAVDFLITEKKLSRNDAYMLVSTAVDLRLTQLVDGTKGAHAMIPKLLFSGARR